MTIDVPVERITQSQIVYCSPETCLYKAAREIQKAYCSSILIVDDGKPVGIWTERDALQIDYSDPDALDAPISKVMSTPVKTVNRKTPVSKVGIKFQGDDTRHYLVVGDDGKAVGIVTQTDVILSMGAEHFLTIRDVKSVLERPLLKVPGTSTVNEVVEKMRKNGIQAAVVEPIADEGMGIITERDLVHLVADRRTQSPVSEVASRPLLTIPQDTTLLQARELLEIRSIRHVAIVAKGRGIIGLLTFSDILKSIQYEYLQRLEATLRFRDEKLQLTDKTLSMAHKVIETSADGIMVVGSDGLIKSVNPAFTTVTGYKAEEVIGRNPRILNSGRHENEYFSHMWDSLNSTGFWQGEIWNKRKTGEIYPQWMTINTILDEHGLPQSYSAIFSDITERKQSEEDIKQLAYFDVLTGLPNRRLFMDRLSMALANAQRHEQHIGVMFMDLDLFKRINDSLGHAVGDRVLKEISGRLARSVREGDTVARLGGDEFTVLLPEVAEIGDVVKAARRAIEDIKKPFELEGKDFYITASIGISIFPEDGETVEALLEKADTAMYRAKDAGRNSYQIYSPTMNARSIEKLSMEESLKSALKREEFDLNYQVKIDMTTGHMSGVEALIRWRHPKMGIIMPAEFLPLAEDAGLIAPIGNWVLKAACRQNKDWQDRGMPPVGVAVNISNNQFWDSGLLDGIKQALDESGLDARYLELELTEETVMRKVEEASSILEQIKNVGVNVSIDNFGTGYSSLSHLKRLPIDLLKIDRSFINDMAGSQDDVAIVSTIIRMGQSLNLKVVAEGVETEEQVAFLKERKCDEIQGYLISRPVSAENLISLFDRNLLPGATA